MAYGFAADPTRAVIFWGLARLLPMCPFRVRTPDTLLVPLARIHALPGWRLSSEYRRRVVLLGSDRVQPTKPVEGDVLVTDKLDSRTIKVLGDGGKVLLLINGKIRKEKGASILNGYSTIFWNTAWTNNQPPHPMGIVCDKWHPVFKEFPTDANSDANWWDATTKSQMMDLDGFPAGLKPLVQMIDTWFENKRLALAFEASAGKGKILVSSIDFKKDIDERISTKQLYVSILNYMNSNAFNPVVSVDVQKIKSLFE